MGGSSFQPIGGGWPPACLRAATTSVETVSPPAFILPFPQLHLVPVSRRCWPFGSQIATRSIRRDFLDMSQQMIKIELAAKDLMNGQRLGNCHECAKRQENKHCMCLLADPAQEMLEPT